MRWSLTLRVRVCAWLAAVFGAIPATAQTMDAPADNAMTVYGSWREGGNFADVANDQSVHLAGSGAWAVSYERLLDPSRQLQFYFSYQSTRLKLDQGALTQPAPSSTPAPLPLRVMYLHFGGTAFVDGPVGRGAYVVGGIGATLFQPKTAGYSSEVHPSLNLGIGYEWPLAQHFALRMEARGYATIVHSSGGLFCSGGCLIQIKADAVAQGEIQLGLSYSP